MKWFRIRNQTDWSTNDLRAVIAAACEAAGMVGIPDVTVLQKKPHVLHWFVTGRAWLGTHRDPGKILLIMSGPSYSKTDSDRLLILLDLARTAHHEALHSVGAHHGDMTEEQRYCRQPVPWADALVLRTKSELRPRPEVSLVERSAAKLAERLEHVQSMHRRAVTRLKRAETLEKKWRRRLKMLERKL